MSSNEEVIEQLRKIRMDVDELIRTFDPNEPTRDELEMQMHRLNVKNTLLSGELFELKMNLKTSEQNWRGLEVKLAEAQQEIKDLHRRNKELDRANVHLRTVNAELKGKFQKLKEETSSTALQLEFEEVVRQRIELQRANANLRSTNAELKRRLQKTTGSQNTEMKAWVRIVPIPEGVLHEAQVMKKIQEISWEVPMQVQMGDDFADVRLEDEASAQRLISQESFNWEGIEVLIVRLC
jgi:chromosome segregation ATPase